MAASSYLPEGEAACEETAASGAAARVGGAAAGKPRRGMVERCQPFLPVATVLLGAVGCMVTIVSEANSTREKIADVRVAQQQAQTANWLSTLQKVGFEEQNLIPTALLMSNFDTVTAKATGEERDRADQARRVERIVLEQTQRPRTFDVVVSDMLGRSTSAERVGELLEVVQELDGRLQRSFREAVAKGGAGKAGKAARMEDFLANPAAFYPGAGEKAQLEHVLATMWELDTISDEIACAVRGNGVGAEGLAGATFLNYAPADGVKAWRSCKVEADDGGAGLDCVGSEGVGVPDC